MPSGCFVGLVLSFVRRRVALADLVSFLDNLRYAVSACLFGYPETEHVLNTPCVTRYDRVMSGSQLSGS